MISEKLQSSGVACDPCIAVRMMHKWKRYNRWEEHSCVELWEEAAAALPEHRTQEILCGNIHLKGDEVFAITEKCFVEKFEHPVLAQSEKK